MLRSFNREDLEILWKLVKAKHGYTRPDEGSERVLWGDLKIMFEHHVEDAVWRNLRENKVLVWKLFDSCGVHFVRFQNLHVFMLVEKRYPLLPATIIDMLNKKLQADHWNEIVIAAKLMLLVYKSLMLVFRVNVAGIKLQLLKSYNCSMIKTAERVSAVRREWIKTEERIKIDWRSRLLM
ncbi:hypothetical protein Tco_1383456 [Tanacetum coccineum]